MFEAAWTCIPYLQLSELMKNLSATLLEQKTSKLEKIYARDHKCLKYSLIVS